MLLGIHGPLTWNLGISRKWSILYGELVKNGPVWLKHISPKASYEAVIDVVRYIHESCTTSEEVICSDISCLILLPPALNLHCRCSRACNSCPMLISGRRALKAFSCYQLDKRIRPPGLPKCSEVLLPSSP